MVAGPEILVAGAGNEFDDNGALANPRYAAALDELMAALRTAAAARRAAT